MKVTIRKLVPTKEQRERILDMQVDRTAREIELAMQAEDMRLETTAEYSVMWRQVRERDKMRRIHKHKVRESVSDEEYAQMMEVCYG